MNPANQTSQIVDRARSTSKCGVMICCELFLAIVLVWAGSARISLAAAEAPATRPFMPWKSARVLLPNENGYGPIIGVLVSNDVAYVATGIYPINVNGFLTVLKVPVNGEPVSVIGKIAAKAGPDSINMQVNNNVICLDDKDVFIRGGGDGVYDFPLDGRDPCRIDTDPAFPSHNATALAVLNGQLYLALELSHPVETRPPEGMVKYTSRVRDGTWIVRIDPKMKQMQVLAWSAQKEKALPMDGGPPVAWMAADVPRQRIVFFITAAKGNEKRSGFWSLSASGAFKQVCPVIGSTYLERGGQPRDGKVSVGLNGCGITGLDFDLASDRPTVFYASQAVQWPKSIDDGLDRLHPRFSGNDFF
ncbi:MAG TPA: hypothetical protein VLI90_19800, partial [Tepidisphaeraceae bacterium]|nr:hypothetical protein [Tepidisphaeraceae bacterium]